MGNSIGSKKKKTVKIMKIDGDTMKFKTPVQADEILNKYPGYVLLESEDVKHFGIRAKPLDLQQVLEPKRLYFLVELPKVDDHGEKGGVAPPRRVRSVIHMNAKDRLESLKLARRSSSDLSIMKQATSTSNLDNGSSSSGANGNGNVGSGVRLKLRLPKAEVEKLMQESKDEGEAAQKFMDLCLANNNMSNDSSSGIGQQQQQVRMRSGHETQGFKKRVSLMPVTEGEIQLAMGASPGIESW